MRLRALHATAAVLLLVMSAGCAGLPLADPATESPTDASAPRAAAPGTVEPGSTPSDGPATAPTSTATPTPRPTPDVTVDERVAVEGGSLPVNASLVFARVEGLLGVNVSAPGVGVSNESGDVTSPGPPPALFQAFGATVEGGPLASCGAIATGVEIDGNVRVGVGGLSESQIELLLVHEFVHVVQGQVDDLSVESADDGRANAAIDDAIEEGGAVYLTHLYASRYGESWGNRSVLSLRRCFYRRAGDDVRVFTGWYYFGAIHFVRRLDGSTNLSRVYANPPRTTEQLVHGLAPGTEPPATLSVAVRGDGPDRRERQGELKLRTMLLSALSPERAAAAAGGWGNDTLLSYHGDGNPNFAWVIRFDDAGEAEEFAAAFREYASRVEQRGDAYVRFIRVSPETVVLFAGSEVFVEDASAAGTNGSVTVTVPDGEETVASTRSAAGPGPLLVPLGVGVAERGLP